MSGDASDARPEQSDTTRQIIDRRRLLAGASGVLATGLAGCDHQSGGTNSSQSSGTGGGQPSPPVIVDATLPPTAVEVDQQVSFDITIDTSPTNVPADASNAVINGYANVLRRGSRTYSAISPTTNVVELSGDRLRLEYIFETPQSAVQWSHASRPQGLGYNMQATATFGGGGNLWNIGQFAGGEEILAPHTIQSSSSGSELWFQTWAFDRVDTTAMVPVLASGESPSRSGVDLFHRIRRDTELTCRYYASELGSMGAVGIDGTVVTRTNDVPSGWVRLPSQASTYQNAANNHPFGNPEQLTEDALDAAANNHGVNFSSWDTAAVLTDTDYGRAFYRGDFVSTPAVMEFGMIDVEIETAALQNMLPVSAYDTPTGRTDYWYDPVEGDAWLHEIGHSLGPGNKVGLPDLYQMQAANLGVIHDWGQMGTDGDVIQSWCRQLGGYFFDPGHWLTKADHLHLATDTSLEVEPLTDKEIGDHAAHLTTMWGEFTVSTQWGGPGNLVPQSVTITPRNVHLRGYVLEARRSGSTRLTEPGTRNTLDRSPASNAGIAIYRFGVLDLQGSVDVQAALNGNDPVTLQNLTAVDYQYVDPSTGNQPEPTLSQSMSSAHRTRTVSDAAMTFEQNGQVAAGSGTSVTVRRTPQSLIGAGTQAVARVAADVASFVEQHLGNLFPAPEPLEIPGVDVLAETPDGRRVGTDPATGEQYEEIEGASVEHRGLRQEVTLPGSVPVSVTMSTARLREALASMGAEVPEVIPTTQELVLTADPQIDDERSIETEALEEPIPLLQGRTRQTHDRPMGAEPLEAVVTPTVEADVRPEGVSEGVLAELLFVDCQFRGPIDPESVAMETVVLDSATALGQDTYDAVPFPVVREGPEARLRFAFDRLALRDRLGAGAHDVMLSGAAGGRLFYAPTTVRLG